MSKCTTCNNECVPKLIKDETLLTDAEEAYLRLFFARTKSLDIRDMINKNASLKVKKIVEEFRGLKLL